MKKINKTISAILAGTTVAAAGVLLGVGLTSWTDDNDDYIVFHYGNEEFVLDNSEINELEGTINSFVSSNDFSILEDVPEEEPTEEPPEGEEPPEEEPAEEEPVDEEDTKKEIAASWIETGFYYVALTGSLPNLDLEQGQEGFGDIEAIVEGSILGTEEYNNENDFNIIDSAESFNNVYDFLVEVTLFRNTSGAGKYVYQYMNELGTQYDYLRPYVAPFMDQEFKTVWDMKVPEFEEEYNELIMHLGYAMSVETDIVMSLYVYSYLYQEHSSDAFDYYMTEQMVNQKPMIMWEMSVTGLNTFNEDEMDHLLDTTVGIEGHYLNQEEMWRDPLDANDYNWQETLDNDHNYSVTDIFKTDMYGTQGFQGFTSGSSASVNIEGFADYDNYQTFLDNDYTEINKIADDSQGKINLAVDANDEKVIVADEDSTTGKVVAFIPLYPFSFAHNYKSVEGTADFYSYSLTAYEVAGMTGVYSYDESTGDEITYFELVSQVIEPTAPTETKNDDLVAMFTNDYLTNTEAFSIWLFDFIYRSNKDSLVTDAQQYWRNEGYYIELSGQYEEDYAELLPLWIQK